MKERAAAFWDIVMGRNEKILARCEDWILPLTFSFSNLLNFAFYYLGLAFAENPVREYGFILGTVLLAGVCLWTFLHLLRRQRIPVKNWILLCLVMVYFCGSFGIGLLTGYTRGTMLGYLKYFVFFGFPAFLAGIVAATRKREDSFFGILEKLSFFGLPGALIYMNGALFDCNPFNYGRDLGYIHYMSFAYTLMPLLLALVLRFADGEPMAIPFSKKNFRHPQLVRGLMILVYWVAVIASATRGAYMCIALFCVLLVISRLVRREPAKKAWLVSIAMAVVLLFNVFVYAPPGMKAVNRMTDFVESLMHGSFVTSERDSEGVDELIDELVQMGGDHQIANRPEGNGKTDRPEDSEPGVPLEPGADMDGENVMIRNRGTLYKLAVKEFLKDPVAGMGPGGYTVKYGLYPHSALLEMLCETGVVGSLILLPLILIAIVRLGMAGWKNKNIWYILMFLLVYALQANISGSLWNCPALLCALGYGLTVPLGRPKNSAEKS